MPNQKSEKYINFLRQFFFLFIQTQLNYYNFMKICKNVEEKKNIFFERKEKHMIYFFLHKKK